MKTGIVELKNKIRVNAFNKRYPTYAPSTVDLKKHIQIYELVKEYNEISTDINNAVCQTSKNLLQNRLKEIESELFSFWVVDDKDMKKDD